MTYQLIPPLIISSSKRQSWIGIIHVYNSPEKLLEDFNTSLALSQTLVEGYNIRITISGTTEGRRVKIYPGISEELKQLGGNMAKFYFEEVILNNLELFKQFKQ